MKLHALHGHTTPETAFVVEDYPIGRSHCRKRYWLERTPHGERLITQMTNPWAQGAWGRLKASSYQKRIGLAIDPFTGRVEMHILGVGASEDAAREFESTWPVDIQPREEVMA
jgi:hypothetical protein